MTALEGASGAKDLDAPSYRMHPLKGDLAGYWAVDVSANRRIIFRFDEQDVTDVELLDYH